MNAKSSQDKMSMARLFLGMPGCNINSNTYIYHKEIAPYESLLFTSREEYQLCFLLKGAVGVHYRQKTMTIPEGKIFFLTGKESVRFSSQTDSDCLLVIVSFRELTDRANMDFFQKLSSGDYFNVHSSPSLLTIPGQLKTFIQDTAENLSNTEIHPSVLELIFTFLRASFTAVNLAILFHEMIEDMTACTDTNRSMGSINPAKDF